MNIIDSLSHQGRMNKNNEDIWGHSDFAAWIFDGATGIADENLIAPDGQTDPRWLVETADASLKQHADKIEDIHRLYAQVLRDCEKAFLAGRKRAPETNYELPMAACIIIKKFAGRIIAGAMSDCTMLIETVHGLQRTDPCVNHAAIDDTTREKMLAAVNRGLSPLDARAELIPHLRANRMKANCPGGYYVFAPTSTLADHVRIEMFEPVQDGHALLMTDGFYALVDQYQAYNDMSLMETAKKKGLDALYKELRQIEKDDHTLTKFPRFKQSDDATAALIKV